MKIERRNPYFVPVKSSSDVIGCESNNIPDDTVSVKADLKLSTEVEKKFLDFITIGLTPKEAALQTDLPIDKIVKYINLNVDNIKYKIYKAVVNRKARHLTRITNGDKAWKCSAFYLERRHPDEYGKEIKIKTTEAKKQVMILGGKEIEF